MFFVCFKVGSNENVFRCDQKTLFSRLKIFIISGFSNIFNLLYLQLVAPWNPWNHISKLYSVDCKSIREISSSPRATAGALFWCVRDYRYHSYSHDMRNSDRDLLERPPRQWYYNLTTGIAILWIHIPIGPWIKQYQLSYFTRKILDYKCRSLNTSAMSTIISETRI